MANELQQIMDRINRVVRSDKPMRAALSTVLAIHKRRIFEQGKDASGAKIGTYSTKPISISRKNQARNTGQTHFKGGYSQYKSAIGKNPGFVNFRNFDHMMGDYGIIVNGDKFGYGFQNSFNYQKSQWLQDKYDKNVFDLSEQELNILADTLKAEIERML